MKCLTLTVILVALMVTSKKVSAQENAPVLQNYRLALGIRLSNSTPTLNNSVTGKYFITNRTAIEGLISFGGRFGLGGLLELHQPFNVAGLKWFYGAGAYVGFQNNPDNTFVGPTGIIGLDYKFNNVPINVSVDWKPELDIIPEINFVPDAFALSVRFAFK